MPQIPGSTMGWVRNILKGDPSVIKTIPPRKLSESSSTHSTLEYKLILKTEWFVDVRDDARVHVAALLDPTVRSERLFAFAAPFNWTDIFGIMRKLRPQNSNIPTGPENEARDLSDIKPSARAEQLIKSFFGRTGWTSLEESLEAGIRDL
jgi:hypothetical protein